SGEGTPRCSPVATTSSTHGPDRQRDQLHGLAARPDGICLRPGRELQAERAKSPALRHVRPQPVSRELRRSALGASSRLRRHGGGRLRNAAERAADLVHGMAQPLPGRRGVGIWYVEDGFQTVAPPEKRRFYRGRENDPHAVPAVASGAEGGAGDVDQATQLRDAVLLAYCQPAVTGFLNFGLLDEDRLGGWQ